MISSGVGRASGAESQHSRISATNCGWARSGSGGTDGRRPARSAVLSFSKRSREDSGSSSLHGCFRVHNSCMIIPKLYVSTSGPYAVAPRNTLKIGHRVQCQIQVKMW